MRRVGSPERGQTRGLPFGLGSGVAAGCHETQDPAGTTALHDVQPLDFATPAAYRGVWCEPEECAASETHPGLGVFDVQSPAMKGYTGQVTLSGYDTMTGLGTPNGQDFITALRAFP
jgi:hypothetical protein